MLPRRLGRTGPSAIVATLLRFKRLLLRSLSCFPGIGALLSQLLLVFLGWALAGRGCRGIFRLKNGGLFLMMQFDVDVELFLGFALTVEVE